MNIPTNVGAVIQRKLTQRPVDSQDIYYVRDSGGVWHYWDFSGRNLRISSDHDMSMKTEESGEFTIVSSGYRREPSGLGAVVAITSVEGVVTKYVKADVATEIEPEAWCEVPFAERWVGWEYLASQGNLRVLSEGV